MRETAERRVTMRWKRMKRSVASNIISPSSSYYHNIVKHSKWCVTAVTTFAQIILHLFNCIYILLFISSNDVLFSEHSVGMRSNLFIFQMSFYIFVSAFISFTYRNKFNRAYVEAVVRESFSNPFQLKHFADELKVRVYVSRHTEGEGGRKSVSSAQEFTLWRVTTLGHCTHTSEVYADECKASTEGTSRNERMESYLASPNGPTARGKWVLV